MQLGYDYMCVAIDTALIMEAILIHILVMINALPEALYVFSPNANLGKECTKYLWGKRYDFT